MSPSVPSVVKTERQDISRRHLSIKWLEITIRKCLSMSIDSRRQVDQPYSELWYLN